MLNVTTLTDLIEVNRAFPAPSPISKEIISVNGQNYYPHDLESVAQRIDGLELGKVVAAGRLQKRNRRVTAAKRLRLPRIQADLASWNVNLTQRKVALHSDTMNEFSEF